MSEDNDKENIEDLINSSSEEASLMLARIDERTRQISQRMEELERMAESADQRSRRNQVVLGAITTAIAIIFTWALNLVPI